MTEVNLHTSSRTSIYRSYGPGERGASHMKGCGCSSEILKGDQYGRGPGFFDPKKRPYLKRTKYILFIILRAQP